MGLEESAFHLNSGWIALISGPMFSGKSADLINYLERASKYARLEVQAFKPLLDKRYGQEKIISHSGSIYQALEVENTEGIIKNLKKSTQVIGISETQFLDDQIIDFCLEQREKNKKLILEGLTTDYKKEPFRFKNSDKNMFDLLIHVEYHILKTAFCDQCGKTAIYTVRNVKSDEQVLVGGKGAYSAACHLHYKLPE